MDSAVLVTMPHGWGGNISHTPTTHSHASSRGNATSSRQQQQPRSSTPNPRSSYSSNHHAASSNPNHNQGHVSIDLPTVLHATSNPSSNNSSSSSSYTNTSVPWEAGWDPQATQAVPGQQVVMFEPLDAGARRGSYRDQQQATSAPRYSSSHTTAIPIPSAQSLAHRSRSTGSNNSSSTGRALTAANRSSSSSSSSSGSPVRFQRLHRHSSSAAGFFSATASQLLSSLGSLGGISLLSSSPASSSGSSSSSRGQIRVNSSSFNRRSIRGSLLIRAPAILDTDTSESYDDLLALDQFNVKRSVRASVLSALPTRRPCMDDQQQQRHCFICFEMWGQQQQKGSSCCSRCQHCVRGDGSECVAVTEAQHTSTSASTAAVADAAVGTAGAAGSTHHHQQQQHDIHLSSPTSDVSRAFGHTTRTVPSSQSQQPEAVPATHPPFATAAAVVQSSRGSSREPAGPLSSGAASCVVLCSCGSYYCSHSITGTTGGRSVTRDTTGSNPCQQYKQQRQQQQESKVVIQQLPCGHEFCVICIGTWLKEHATCPVCRWTFPDEHTQLININK